MTTTTTCSEFRCRRSATGDDGRCGPHRTGHTRRLANDARRRADGEAYHRRAVLDEARRAYAERWRELHPELAYTRAWTCPLCGLELQSTLADAGAEHSYAPALEAIRAHTTAHGAAWGAYHAPELA